MLFFYVIPFPFLFTFLQQTVYNILYLYRSSPERFENILVILL